MTILAGIVLLLPLVLGLVALGRPKTTAAPLVLAVYIYPIVAILMAASPGYSMPALEVSESVGNALRAGVHVVVLWMLGLVVIWKGRVAVANASLLTATAAAATLMGVSVFLVGSSSAVVLGLLRAGLVTVLAVNTLILVPTAVGNRAPEFVDDLARGLYGMMLGVICVAVYVRIVYGAYPEWSPRLGRPLNPRVLSDLLVVATILVTVTTDRIRYGLVLAVAIVATGSRLSIALTGLFFVTYAWSRRRRLISVGLVALGAVGGVALLVAGGSGVFARSEPFAGRLLLWGAALSRLPSVWMWGTGERFMLSVESDDPLLQMSRIHNGPLEAVVSYGVWFALAAFAVYVLLARRLVKRAGSDEVTSAIAGGRARTLGLWLLGVALLESIVGTSTWTNLGEPFSLIVLIILSTIVMDIRRAGRLQPATGR